MGILKKIARSFVYHFTEKPLQYVHVDKPEYSNVLEPSIFSF